MTEDKPFHIVVAEPFDPEAVTRLQTCGRVEVLADSMPETLLAALTNADALLVRSRTHVTARIIEAAPSLKVIGRASPTIDHIDLRAARRRNISVVYAPHAAVASLAEFTFALILSTHRRIPCFNRQLREGQFDLIRKPAAREMRNQIVGLLGIDVVAEEVGRMCVAAFGSQIVCHDPAGGKPVGLRAEVLDLDSFFAAADIVSVHLPQAQSTRHFLNAARLAKMKQAAILVNASRGGTIDTVALADALKNHVIAGAALDVFESEPLPANHPLRRAPNCILTPHVAGLTHDAATSRFAVADDVIRVLNGQPPEHPADLPA
jgi:D-3-phosphoglycerate dehydrogenase